MTAENKLDYYSWFQSALIPLITEEAADTPVTSVAAANNDPEHSDPEGFRKLIEGILYSSRLVLAYHFTIVAFILVVSALHWSHHFIRWRKRRGLGLRQGGLHDQDALITGTEGKPVVATSYTDETSSSGSSTLGGASSPPQKLPTEHTPLLHDGQQLRVQKSKRTLLSPLKGILIYQPRPIPFFNKTLPSNGSSLLLLAFIGLNMFYVLFHINFNVLELFIFADRCGMLFAANLPLLYILAAKTQPLRILTGYSYESLNIFHRRLGEIMCLEALLHAIGMCGVWYSLLRPTGWSLIQFLTTKVIVLGLLALIAYETLYFTSLASFRQRWYELFLGLHIILQASALAFLFFHHPGSRIYVGTALAIFLVDRLAYRLGFKSTTVEATTTIMEDGDTIKLSCKISLRQSPSALIGKSISGGWDATDHVFLTAPFLARKHLFQAHPFTILSPPPNTNQKSATLDLLIRARDGFTADLLRKARTHKSLQVRLNGPYGSSHAISLLEDADLAIVVAGGSGIAVAWPILHHLLCLSQSRDAEMATTSPDGPNIIFIWVIREDSHLSWIGKQALEDMKMNGVRVIVPGTTEIVGRPDLKAMIEDIVEEGGERRIGVVASGPDEMGRVVRNACAGLAWKGRDIGVTIEKFGW